MPAIYAHDRFGRLVFERVSDELRDIIERNYSPYQIGLQGPDIFFFCRPWGGVINRYGNHLHHISAYPFFQHARKVVMEKGRDSAEYAYLLGFICHYILDSECHGYVEEMIEVTGAKHLEVEEEFEKMLLKMDGEDPVAFPIGSLVPTDRATAEAVRPFYADGITTGMVHLSMKDMKMVKNVFTAPHPVKQGIINTIMKMTGHYAGMKGLMNQRKDNPACEESNEGLLLRFEEAIDIAVDMMESFDKSLKTRRPLHRRFDRTFE